MSLTRSRNAWASVEVCVCASLLSGGGKHIRMTVVARTRARYKTFVAFVHSFAAQAGSRTGVQLRLLPRRQGLRGVTKPNVCLHTVPESKQTINNH